MVKYKKVWKRGKKYTVTKSDGSKETRYMRGRYVKVRVKDSNSSSRSSNSSSSSSRKYKNNSNELFLSRTPIGGGKTQYKVDGKWQDSKPIDKPKRHHHSSSSRSSGTGTIIMNNTKTGVTTTTKVNLSNGKTLSIKSKKTPKKINLASYEDIYGKKVNPKSKDIKDLLKVKSISPSLQQQLQQKQTTSRELKAFVKKLNAPKKTSLALVTEGEKRFFKGERLVNLGGYTTVIDKNGKARALTNKELKELKENPDLVNPLRVFTGAFMGGAQLRNLVNNPNLLAQGAKEFVKAPVTSTVNMLASAGKQLNKDPFGFTGEMLAFEGVGGAVAKGARGVSRTVKTSKVGAKIGNTVKKIRLFEEDQLLKLNSRINQLEKQGITNRGRSLEARELRLLQEQKKIFEKYKYYTAPIDKLKTTIAKDVKVLESTRSPIKKKQIANKITKDLKEANKLVDKRNKLTSSKKIKDHKKALKEFEKERLAQNKKSKKKISQGTRLRQEVKIVSEEIIVKTLKDNFKNPTKLKQLKKIIKEERGLNVKILQTPKGLKVILKEGGKNAKKGVKTANKERIYLVTKDKKLIRVDKQRKGTKVIEDPLIKKEKKKLEKDLEFKEGQNLDKVLNDLKRHENKRTSLLGNKKAQVTMLRSTGRAYKKVEKTTKQIATKTKKFVDDYRARLAKQNKQNKVLKKKGKKSRDFSKSEREKFTKQKKRLEKELKENIKEIKAFKKSLIKMSKLVPALAVASKSLQGTLNKQEKLLEKAQDVLQKQDLKLDPIKDTPNKNKGNGKGGGKGKGGKSSGGGSSSTIKTTKKPTPNSRGRTGKLKTPDPKPKPKPKPRLSGKSAKKIKFNKVTTKGEIIYVNEKGKKVKIKTGLPYDWAYKVALETIDESLLGSTRVKKYGRIKARTGLAFDKSLLKKFRDKKSKNPKVQEFVEKAKYRLDTKSEVSSIQSKKILANKLKIAKETLKELKKANKKTKRSKSRVKSKKAPLRALKSKKRGGKK